MIVTCQQALSQVRWAATWHLAWSDPSGLADPKGLLSLSSAHRQLRGLDNSGRNTLKSDQTFSPLDHSPSFSADDPGIYRIASHIGTGIGLLGT